MSSASDPLPTPPWSRARRRTAPARVPLTQDAIVEAALAIVDAEGLEGLSMRRVAERFDTGAATLYQHVPSKEALLELLFDRVVGEIPLPDVQPPGGDWQAPMKQMLRNERRVLAAHRDLAYVSLGMIPTGPNALALAERALAILRAGGVPAQVAAFALDMLGLFIGATVYEDSIETTRFESIDEYIDSVRAYFQALPADRFPVFTSMIDELMAMGDHEDARFEFALDVHIRGIAALAADAAT